MIDIQKENLEQVDKINDSLQNNWKVDTVRIKGQKQNVLSVALYNKEMGWQHFNFELRMKQYNLMIRHLSGVQKIQRFKEWKQLQQAIKELPNNTYYEVSSFDGTLTRFEGRGRKGPGSYVPPLS